MYLALCQSLHTKNFKTCSMSATKLSKSSVRIPCLNSLVDTITLVARFFQGRSSHDITTLVQSNFIYLETLLLHHDFHHYY